MREAFLHRKTSETDVAIKINLDSSQEANQIQTGIGFLNHMLNLLAVHSGFSLQVAAKGDLETGSHHTIEDIGIVLGQVFAKALSDKSKINRYGSFFIPMDEALAFVSADVSGRSYLVYDVDEKNFVSKIVNYETDMTREFFRAFAMNANLTLHIRVLYGTNTHHIIEAIFKAVAHALKIAVSIDEERTTILSSKGVL